MAQERQANTKKMICSIFLFRGRPSSLLASETPGMARRKRQMALQNELWQFDLARFPQKFIALQHGNFKEDTLAVGYFSMAHVFHL